MMRYVVLFLIWAIFTGIAAYMQHGAFGNNARGRSSEVMMDMAVGVFAAELLILGFCY